MSYSKERIPRICLLLWSAPFRVRYFDVHSMEHEYNTPHSIAYGLVTICQNYIRKNFMSEQTCKITKGWV
jgi:hypothetical protein